MEISNKFKLFKYLNWEYQSKFDMDSVGDPGQIPFCTGDIKQDAYILHVRNEYGLVLTSCPKILFKWNVQVIDKQKFTWLLLKI